MNCYGARDLRTPHMDTLAARGVRFTQFYAAPVSSASRASLMTGQSPPVRDLRGMPGTGACRRTRRRLPSVCGQTVTGQPVSASGTWGRSGSMLRTVGDSIISGDFWEAASTAIRISTIGEVRTGTTSGATIGRSIAAEPFLPKRRCARPSGSLQTGTNAPSFSIGPSISLIIRFSRRRSGWSIMPICPSRAVSMRLLSRHSMIVWAG